MVYFKKVSATGTCYKDGKREFVVVPVWDLQKSECFKQLQSYRDKLKADWDLVVDRCLQRLQILKVQKVIHSVA